MNKIKVGMVAACPFPENRGTPGRILRMAQALAGRGHEVHVITYHLGSSTAVEGVQMHRTPRVSYRRTAPGPSLAKLLVLDPLLLVKTYRIARARRLDLLHAHHFEAAIISCLLKKLLAIPVIYDAHTTLRGEMRYYDFCRCRRLERFLDREVPRRADHVIAVSEGLKDAFLGFGIERAKIDVIPTGTNVDHFRAAAASETEHLKRSLNLAGRQIIMYTGSTAPYQGVEHLLAAAEMVLAARKQAALLLVTGAAPSSFDLALKTRHPGARIRWLHDVSYAQLPRYLALADVVVSPRPECPGMPQKLVNYMAARKAIVSYAGSAGILKHRYNGLVVENGDLRGLARAIATLLDDEPLRVELGRNAGKTAADGYDWPILGGEIEELYQRLLRYRAPLAQAVGA